jgi:N-acetyl-S-(2-succino)cysteine monooxygenase
MMILGANIRALGSHLAGWRHPEAWPNAVMQLQNSIEMSQMVEAAKLHFVFLADGNGVRQMSAKHLFAATAPSDRPAVFEPVTLLTAIAMATKHVGLVATATTTYEEPYLLARKFASLDHISHGRAGWNLVTTSNADDALNFGRDEHMPREERYERAREFADVVRGLWDSWADDAFPQDKNTGRFLDPRRLHLLSHAGKYFTVRGPLNITRPPQGHPTVFSAGQSDAGRDLAASSADCLFAVGSSLEESKQTYADIKGRLAKFGRQHDDLKILPGVVIYVGETSQEAEEYYQSLQDLIPPELGLEYLSKTLEMDLSGYPLDGPVPKLTGQKVGGTAVRYSAADFAYRHNLTIKQAYQHVVGSMGGNMFKGSVAEVCDEMETWYREKACDGFVLSGPTMPGGMRRILDKVVPELQRRGVFRRDHGPGTLRGGLGLRRPPNPYFDAPAAAAE